MNLFRLISAKSYALLIFAFLYVSSAFTQISETLISVYPNPTSGSITVSASGGVLEELRIFDNAEKLIDVIELGGNSQSIDLSSYAIGVYQFQVKAENTIYWERILKN